MNRPLSPNLPRHIPSLDGLRAVSIGLVLLAHAAATAGAPSWLDKPMIVSLGNVGVRFFFVISGFLITTLLLRDIERYGTVQLKLFYGRRALRILPAFLCYVGVMWALHLGGVISLNFHVPSRTYSETIVPDLVHALTFTANYFHDYNWYFNHLWTLSVEEQFYLLWPFALGLLGAYRGMVVACCLLLVAPAVRLAMYLFGTGPEIALSREFQAVCDALAMGCLAALLHNRISEHPLLLRLVAWPGLVLGVLLVGGGYGLAIASRPAAYVLGQSLANVGILIILQHVVRHPEGGVARILNTRPFVGVGVLSYSLYLWQEPFLYFLPRDNWATSFPQNLALAFGVAALSYYLVERPMLRLKDRLSSPTVRAPRPQTPQGGSPT